MKFTEIKDQKNKHWDAVWQLYESSFPEHERRQLASHMAALSNPDFKAQMVVDEDKLLAIFFYWETEGFIYGEHLAVNPEMRGQNIGSRLMSAFLEQNREKGVILEIDPPLDDISIRRLHFYKRLGMKENPYEYTHPSYKKDGHLHRLDIMSYPDAIDELKYQDFCKFMEDTVLKYIDE